MNNTIQISKRNIPKLKANSELLNIIISRNFSNSNNYFNEEGNFFLDRSLVPDLDILQYEGLREAIEKGYVEDPQIREFIKDYFLFRSSLEPRRIESRRTEFYFPEPGKKRRQKIRKLEELDEERRYRQALLNLGRNFRTSNAMTTLKKKNKRPNIRINNNNNNNNYNNNNNNRNIRRTRKARK